MLFDRDRQGPAFYHSYERMDDPDPKREGIDRDGILIYLHSNSNRVVLIKTMETEKFYIGFSLFNPCAQRASSRGKGVAYHHHQTIIARVGEEEAVGRVCNRSHVRGRIVRVLIEAFQQRPVGDAPDAHDAAIDSIV